MTVHRGKSEGTELYDVGNAWAKGEHVNIYNYMMSIWFSFFIILNTINRWRFSWFIPLVRFRFSSSTFHWFLSKEHARNISKWRPSFVNPWLYVLTAHSSDHGLFTFGKFSINSRFIYIWVCFRKFPSLILFFWRSWFTSRRRPFTSMLFGLLMHRINLLFGILRIIKKSKLTWS